MVVVDVNVVAYLLIAGERSAAARELWAADPDWRLPPLWRCELLNILATIGRTGRGSRDELIKTWRAAHTLLEGADHETDPESVLGIALEHRLSAYDAQYIAVARDLKTVLVTEDLPLRRALPNETRSLEAWLSDSGQN